MSGGRWSGRAAVVDAGRSLARVAGPLGADALPLAVGAVVFAIGTLGFGEVYEGVQERGDLAAFDAPVLAAAVAWRTPGLNAVVTAFTALGGPIVAPILTLAAVVGLTVARRSWTPALVVVPAALGSLLMTVVGKRVFGRTRPPLADAVPPFETSPSFPSGHTLNAIVIAGAIAYVLLLRRRTAAGRVAIVAVAAGWAVAMGLSRVLLGHHWLTDVVAAWALGAAWLAVVITAHRLLLTRRRATA